MRMKKKPLNLLVNEDLVKKAREHGINLSAFLDIELRRYLALIESKPAEKNETPRRRFELLLPRWRTGSQGRRVRPDFATSASFK